MDGYRDQAYLLNSQYKDATNFSARINLHRLFVLENGHEVLASFFTQVTLHTYEDALEVTEAEPLAAYALSGKLGSLLSSQKREAFTGLIRQELAERGTLHITNASGMFEAHKA